MGQSQIVNVVPGKDPAENTVPNWELNVPDGGDGAKPSAEDLASFVISIWRSYHCRFEQPMDQPS